MIIIWLLEPKSLIIRYLDLLGSAWFHVQVQPKDVCPEASHESVSQEYRTLGIQIAQNGEYLRTLGPKVSFMYLVMCIYIMYIYICICICICIYVYIYVCIYIY